MKRRVLSVMAAAVMTAVILAGCGSGKADGTVSETQAVSKSEETKSEEDTQKEEAKEAAETAMEAVSNAASDAKGEFEIALLPTDMSATFAAWLAQELQIAVKEYPNMTLTILDSKNTLSTQLANLENCVTQGYDYIILHPLEPDAEAELVDQYIQDGTPILMVNQSDGGSQYASNVDCDPIEQGSIVAKVAAEKIPQNGKVVILLGPSGNSHSIGRREGFQKILFDARPDIEILDEQIGDWEKSKGMNFMEDWLQAYDQIDAAVSMNDAMALGAWEAANDAKRAENMTFYGVDGLADAVLSIKDGGLTATCVQNAKVMAETTFGIIDKVLAGEEEFEKTLIEGQLIDENNVDEWIKIHTDNGQIK